MFANTKKRFLFPQETASHQFDNTLASHRRSYGSIAVYKNPNTSQWLVLWTVYDASRYLMLHCLNALLLLVILY